MRRTRWPAWARKRPARTARRTGRSRGSCAPAQAGAQTSVADAAFATDWALAFAEAQGDVKPELVKRGYVYIMASGRNGTLYTGVTSDLAKRVGEHQEGLVPGFTKRYGCKFLVWFETHDDLGAAQLRELQMKKWKRQWKLSEIERLNPEWHDLFAEIFEGSSGSLTGPLPSQGHGA